MAVRNGLASHSQWNPDNAALFVYEIDLRHSHIGHTAHNSGQNNSGEIGL